MKHTSYPPAVKRVFAGLLLVFCAVSAQAQVYYMSVFGKDGSRTKYEISDLDSIKLTNEPGPIPGLEHVDLGLSVEWASFNVGATNPYEPGDYFAYGETQTKETYTRQSYKYYDPTILNGYTKYNFHSKYGKVDYKYRLDMEDDAARVNWGSDWRMPTIEEMSELVLYCNWEWVCDTTKTRFKGYKVTGPNGNYILLPVAQYRDDEESASSYDDGNGCASYLSSSLYPGDTWSAIGIDITYELYKGIWYSEYDITYEGRIFGELIRPVYSWKTPENVSRITHFDLVEKSVTLNVGDIYELKFDMDESSWAMPVLTVPVGLNYHGDYGIAAVIPGTYVVTANLGDFTSELKVTVTEPKIVSEGVDLGLSVKWATCNLGAETPSGYGFYYAWGETDYKPLFSLGNYQLWDSTGYLKYTPADGKRILDAEDDAAKKLWGDNWRIPSFEEYMELVNYCSWEWIEQENGICGYRITSLVEGYEDQSIFIPAAGYDAAYNKNYAGYYWLSSIGEEESDAVLFYLRSKSNYFDAEWDRYHGLSIRPVLPLSSSGYDTLMLDKTELDLTVGKSYTLMVEGRTPIGSIVSLTGGVWTSDNESVATVKDGVIVAVGDGTCTITVAFDDRSVSCTVTVVDLTNIQPEYVDLGLSVNWATFNIGAFKPEMAGDYYSWGSLEESSNYRMDNYRFFKEYDSIGYEQLTKYKVKSPYGYDYYGETDDLATLEKEDDVAYVKWGDSWRMPTETEFEELMRYCDWEWTCINGVYGYEITSMIEGYTEKSIFLPFAGYKNSNGFNGSYGRYWSSSIYEYQSAYAWSLRFTGSVFEIVGLWRSNGITVRPVSESDTWQITNVVLDADNVVLTVGGIYELKASIWSGKNDYSFMSELVTWTSNNESVATVNNGIITAVSPGTATITVSCKGQTSTCPVKVNNYTPVTEYVDLGLSVPWATCNVGAMQPEEFGQYFAWGEVEPKTTFTAVNYRFANNEIRSGYTKYNFFEEYGQVDYKYGLDAEDDAARVILGSEWRMPTIDEMSELVARCEWTWTSVNSVDGYQVVGPNGNSIFLPAGGYRYDVGSGPSQGWTSYLTSTLSDNIDGCAMGVDFSSSTYYPEVESRYFGELIRPVYSSSTPKNVMNIEGISLIEDQMTVYLGTWNRLYANIIGDAESFDIQPKLYYGDDDGPDIVELDETYNGYFTAIGTGTCIIKVVIGEYSVLCTVRVIDDEE